MFTIAQHLSLFRQICEPRMRRIWSTSLIAPLQLLITFEYDQEQMAGPRSQSPKPRLIGFTDITTPRRSSKKGTLSVDLRVYRRQRLPGCFTKGLVDEHSSPDANVLTLANEFQFEGFSQAHGRLNLREADRDAFHVDAERNTHMSAVSDQFPSGPQRVLIRLLQRVVRVTQVILDPARHVDAEPAQNSSVLSEPHTENVNTIGTGGRFRAAHS